MKVEAENQSTQHIPVREGILLDRDGNAIGGPSADESYSTFSSTSGRVFQARVFRPRGIMGPIVGALVLIAIAFAGVTLAGFLFAAWAVYLIIRAVISIFSLGSGPSARFPKGARHPMRRGY